VFELTPPSKIGENWTESILWSFGNGTDGNTSYAGLIMDTSGNLYGTTEYGGAYGSLNSQGGTAFELTPPVTSGGDWTESILWNSGNGTDGAEPQAGLIMDTSGNLYGTAGTGGAYGEPGGYGTVFEISTGSQPVSTVLAASPAQLNFGNVAAAKTSKPKKVTLSNKGTLAAMISNVTATAPFTIAGGANTCSGQTIAPKKTCSFYVEFAPTTVANVTGSINVTYNGTSPAVVLKGNGIAAR
jgi:hypothetical protein